MTVGYWRFEAIYNQGVPFDEGQLGVLCCSVRFYFHPLVLGGACSSTDGSAINSDACTCGEDVCAMSQFCDASQATGSECTSRAGTFIKFELFHARTAFCARQFFCNNGTA